MNKIKTKICSKCVLPSTFPHITFNQEGVCIHCQRFVPENLEKARKVYKQKFLNLIADNRRVVVAYSGGKDSTYTLLLLKVIYDLDVTALTFDNHFISPQAWNNIKNVTDALDIKHVIYQVKKKELFTLFRKALETELFSKKSLERASTLCTTCSGIFKAIVLSYALENDIPLIGFGWSPGQAPISSAIAKYVPDFVETTRNVMVKAIKDISPDIAHDVTLADYEKSYLQRHDVYNIHPLAFEDYDEHTIKEQIKSLGWVDPTDVDTNSTNCRLNCLANKHHLDIYKFHPYVWEIANMVRQGTMSRQEGIEKIYNDSNDDVTKIKEELHAY